MYQGTVVDFTHRGFGFILPNDSRRQIFFHIRDVVDQLTPRIGDRVSFHVVPSPKGNRAVQVRLLSEAEAHVSVPHPNPKNIEAQATAGGAQ